MREDRRDADAACDEQVFGCARCQREVVGRDRDLELHPGRHLLVHVARAALALRIEGDRDDVRLAVSVFAVQERIRIPMHGVAVLHVNHDVAARSEAREQPPGRVDESEHLDVLGKLTHPCDPHDLPASLRQAELLVGLHRDLVGDRDFFDGFLRHCGGSATRPPGLVAEGHRLESAEARDRSASRRSGGLDVLHVLEQLLEGEPRLEPGERGAEALVDPAPESEMARHLAMDVERGRIGKDASVEVCCSENAVHERAGRQVEACDGARPRRSPEAVVDRPFDTERLFDGVRNQPWSFAELAKRSRARQKLVHHQSDQLRRRLVSSDQQQLRETEELLRAELLRPLGRADHEGEQVVPRMFPCVGDGLRQVRVQIPEALVKGGHSPGLLRALGHRRDEKASGDLIRPSLEVGHVGSIDAQQLRDHGHGQGNGEVPDEVELAPAIQDVPHELARDREDSRRHRLRDARGRERLCEERAQAGVVGRVVADERAQGAGARRRGEEPRLRREREGIAEHGIDVPEAQQPGDVVREDTTQRPARARVGEDPNRALAELVRVVTDDRQPAEGDRRLRARPSRIGGRLHECAASTTRSTAPLSSSVLVRCRAFAQRRRTLPCLAASLCHRHCLAQASLTDCLDSTLKRCGAILG